MENENVLTDGFKEAKKRMLALYGENKKIDDGNYDKSLAVRCVNGIFVGKKAGETQTLEIIIEFVKQMPDAQQRRVLNIVQALAKDTLIAAEAIEDAVKDNQPKTKMGKKK